MTKSKRNPVREDRIHNEAIVDAYGPEEQAMGWYQPFLDQMEYPSVPDAMLEKRNHPGVGKRPKAIPNVRIQHPIHLLPYDPDVERI
jgi:hypothetical protein